MMTGMSLDPNLITGSRKTAIIDRELSNRRVDIAALQETRLAGTGSIREADYTFYWSGRPEADPRQHGVGFAVSKRVTGSITGPHAINERLATIRLHTNRGYIMLISAYAPTLVAEAEDKDHFYSQIEETMRTVPKSDIIALLGDFNARTGADFAAWPDCLGHFVVGKINENGQHLHEVCCKYNLCISNSYFPGKPHRKMSWCHPRSKTWHQLDFVIVRRSHISEVRYTRSYHSADCDTDHSLVCSKINLVCKPTYRRKTRSTKIDVSKTFNQDLAKTYRQLLEDKKFCSDQQTDATSLWKDLFTQIHSSALLAFGKRISCQPDWFTLSLRTITPVIEAKEAALINLKNQPTPSNVAKHRAARAQAQKTTRKCVNDYWDEICEDIESARLSGNIQRMYNGIRQAIGPTAQKTGVLKTKDGTAIAGQCDKLVRWTEHYSELYGKESPVSIPVIQALPDEPVQEELDTPSTLEELEKIILSLSNGTAAGSDEIPAELLKAGGAVLIERVHQLTPPLLGRIRCTTGHARRQRYKDLQEQR